MGDMGHESLSDRGQCHFLNFTLDMGNPHPGPWGLQEVGGSDLSADVVDGPS